MRFLLMIMLVSNVAFANVLRNDKLKELPIESVTFHQEMEHASGEFINVVNVKYLDAKYSRHEFTTKKERRAFVKIARKQVASIATIIAARKKG